MRSKGFTVPELLVMLIIVTLLSLLCFGAIKRAWKEKKALEVAEARKNFVTSIPWKEKENFLSLDNCDVYLFRNGCFLISENAVDKSPFPQVLRFVDGLTAIEEMGYRVRTQIAREQLPNDMMIVWATKKEPE